MSIIAKAVLLKAPYQIELVERELVAGLVTMPVNSVKCGQHGL